MLTHANAIPFFWTQTYLGIQIFRFYFKCTVESGASRNFEPWCEQDEVSDFGAYSKDKFDSMHIIFKFITMMNILLFRQQTEKRKRDAEEGDAMKEMENRAMDSKQDMDIRAALEEMRSMKVGSSSRPLVVIISCAVYSLDMLVSLLTRCLKF
jgi:hypothetical protein